MSGERSATLPTEFGSGSHLSAAPWTGQNKLAAALLAELSVRFIFKIAARTTHGLSLLHSAYLGKENNRGLLFLPCTLEISIHTLTYRARTHAAAFRQLRPSTTLMVEGRSEVVKAMNF